MFKFKFLLSVFCLTQVFNLSAQDLLPFVENFTKSEYNGDNQVWSLTQAKDNTLYFANNHYFLRYNGVKWEKYSLPNKTIIRSVFADGDRVYCGSYREFGYWKRVDGKMVYFSLSNGKKLFTGSDENEEIWKIFKYKDKIYFQTFNVMFAVSGTTIETIKFPSQISYCYLANNSVYAATVKNGVYKLVGNSFRKMEAWGLTENNVIHGIEENSGQTYIFTKTNGIFSGTEQSLLPWRTAVNSLLKNDAILTAKFINKNTLAVGTALQGLYIIDINTGLYKNINRKNAIKNNAVLALLLDKENDLWMGLDNGVSHIEVNSPVRLFLDSTGILGSVYSLYAEDDYYLFATNHGVFEYENKSLLPVPGSQGQVWDIFYNGSKFIIGHNDGTFTYDGHNYSKANSVTGGWRFVKSNHADAYFQGNYLGVAVYNDINKLENYKMLGTITRPFKNIVQNKPGELWAADSYRGLYRILYNDNFEVTRYENVSQQNNISNDYGVKLFSFKNETLFYLDNSWYEYDRINNKLELNKEFNTSFKNITDIITIDDNSFMVIKDGLLYLIAQVDNEFIWKLIPEKYYAGKLIMEDTRVFKSGSKLLVNLDDGFMSFDTENSNRDKTTISIEAFYMGQLMQEDTRVKYNQSVEINVISNFLGYDRPDLFYQLNNAGPYIPIKNGSVVLNNLNSGNQDFNVFYNDGKDYKEIVSYNFNVTRPWYLSFWMILAYIIVMAGILFLYFRWNKVRYIEKIKLNEEELKHRRQILELEMEAENKLRQQEYEKHILEMEVQNKASEVAGKSLSIAKHSEMIESILEALESKAEGGELKSAIKKIIKTSSLSKHEWQSFEKNLVKSHEEFVDRLSKKFPMLTPKDIKLCIYLKMNLSSKEIAPLMNISYRGVELHRYRLRKKLNLSQDESLTRFMITL